MTLKLIIVWYCNSLTKVMFGLANYGKDISTYRHVAKLDKRTANSNKGCTFAKQKQQGRRFFFKNSEAELSKSELHSLILLLTRQNLWSEPETQDSRTNWTCWVNHFSTSINDWFRLLMDLLVTFNKLKLYQLELYYSVLKCNCFHVIVFYCKIDQFVNFQVNLLIYQFGGTFIN